MHIDILKLKVHKAVITEANLDYIGSVTLDDALNGPAVRKGMPGDMVVIISDSSLPFEEAKTFKPTIIFPKPGNQS